MADKDKNGNDSDAYEPTSIKVKMRTKDKGKGKVKDVQQKEDRKMRKQLESTGVVREKSCKHCEHLKQNRFIQKEGVACYACAVVKMKCEELVEGEIVEKKKRAMKLATHTKTTPATQPTKHTPATKHPSTIKPISLSSEQSSPTITPPPQAFSSKCQPLSPPPHSSPSKCWAQSPPPQEPKPKHWAVPKKKDEHISPATYHHLLERINVLKEEAKSQQEIINVFLPGYLQLKDKVDTLHGSTIEINNDNMKFQEDLQSHFHRIRSLDEKVKELMIRMESESESSEEGESDDVVVIVEQGPATKLKSQSRPVKGESRPANVKYDYSAPAEEDLDEIEEWPAKSDQDVNELIVEPVVQEVVNREDGQHLWVH